MSLKGYEWLDDDGKVIMSFFFKDLSLYIWEDIREEQYNEFIEYIKNKGFEILHTNFNGHEVRATWFNRGA